MQVAGCVPYIMGVMAQIIFAWLARPLPHLKPSLDTVLGILATPSSALTLHVVLSAPIAPHWDLLPHTITAFYRCNPFLADLPPPQLSLGVKWGVGVR